MVVWGRAGGTGEEEEEEEDGGGRAERRRCARWDSRPAEKAKEPRGRAESERRRRVCVTVICVYVVFCVLALVWVFSRGVESVDVSEGAEWGMGKGG